MRSAATIDTVDERRPTMLRPGDRVRIVSPASTPEKDGVYRCADIFRSWGLQVELGKSVFREVGYLAGTDEERIEDFILGGLPVGHGKNPATVPLGTHAILDADAGVLQIESGVEG